MRLDSAPTPESLAGTRVVISKCRGSSGTTSSLVSARLKPERQGEPGIVRIAPAFGKLLMRFPKTGNKRAREAAIACVRNSLISGRDSAACRSRLVDLGHLGASAPMVCLSS